MKRGFSPEGLKTATQVCFAESRRVRFQDVDAAETLFFPRVLEYMSDAYVGLLYARGLDVAAALRARAFAAPIVHSEVHYLRPLRFGDAVTVEVVAIDVSARSYRLGYRLRDASGQAAAVGQTAHVCVDMATFAPRRLPEELRQALAGDGPSAQKAAR
ncbi:MAG: acyl-CoA thioesterase [Myxococcales bacterium]|nr:acyl-CoA thioesterase [Myxococcales bacterium]